MVRPWEEISTCRAVTTPHDPDCPIWCIPPRLHTAILPVMHQSSSGKSTDRGKPVRFLGTSHITPSTSLAYGHIIAAYRPQHMHSSPEPDSDGDLAQRMRGAGFTVGLLVGLLLPPLDDWPRHERRNPLWVDHFHQVEPVRRSSRGSHRPVTRLEQPLGEPGIS